MSHLDLTALSLPELRILQKDVTRAITVSEGRRRAEARAELEETAKRLGFSFAELAGFEPGRRSRTKYRHPDNPALTWGGRGRRPTWFAQAMAAGKSPEAYMI